MRENIMNVAIEDLPDPIIEYILSYLSPYRDLKQCMLVNKSWYKYVCDVIRKTQRDFNNAICSMSVQWCSLVAEPGPTISKRYSHSACCVGHSMYVFGGCTTANTTFNDLWRLDLGTRCWIRPLATGTYPPPKACATLVNHGDNLVLFGGWTHTSPYPLHQVWRVFNHLHIYNTNTNRWTQVMTANNANAMAGHSATMHGDSMVVFGGIQRQNTDGPFSRCNDLWVLDMKTYSWYKQSVPGVKPLPRYGHSQVAIDKDHLLIIGGCGGPNMLITDIWLLKMDGTLGNNTWQWVEMEVRMKENGAPHLAFHPACKVGNQVVVMSKTQKSRTSPSSLPHLLRAPSRIWIPPRLDVEESVDLKGPVRHQIEIEPCVNGKRGVLKRPIDRRENLSSQMSSSDEDDFHSRDSAKKKPSYLQSKSPCKNGSSSSSSFHQKPENGKHPSPSSLSSLNSGSLPSTSRAPVETSSDEHKTFGESSSSSFRESAGPMTSRLPSPLMPYARRNRQRQLEGLDRMEQRLRDLRAASFSSNVALAKEKQHENHYLSPSKNPMCLYVLDISKAVSDGFVSWRLLKNQTPTAPEEIILYSLVLGKGELIMFGGIQKDLNTRQQGETIPEVVSNSLHFMSAQRFII